MSNQMTLVMAMARLVREDIFRRDLEEQMEVAVFSDGKEMIFVDKTDGVVWHFCKIIEDEAGEFFGQILDNDNEAPLDLLIRMAT